MQTAYSIIEADSFAGVEHHQDAWNRLAQRAEWPLATFEWTKQCFDHLSEGRELRILLALRASELAGVVPFVRYPSFASACHLPGSEALYEPSVLLGEDEDTLRGLVSYMTGLGFPFVLTRLLDAPVVDSALRAHGILRGHTARVRASGAPFLALSTYDAFVASMSANRRNSLARKRRQLERLGHVEHNSCYPEPDEIGGYITAFEQLEAAGWKGARGSAISHRHGFQGFFPAALKDLARYRYVRFDTLALNGNPIAIQFGLVFANRYHLLKPTYDESYARHSPGSLLSHGAIVQSLLERLISYEFLGSSEDWKLQWATGVRETGTFVFYPANLRGMGRLASDAIHTLKRRVRRQSPSQ